MQTTGQRELNDIASLGQKEDKIAIRPCCLTSEDSEDECYEPGILFLRLILL